MMSTKYCKCGCGKQCKPGNEFIHNHHLTCNSVDRLKAVINEKCVVNERGCLVWTGSKSTKGYGIIGFRGKNQRITRLLAKLFIGDPRGMLVCHSCDNPQCVNVEHLFLGTPKDNSQDMVEKDRHMAGSRNHRAKLHENDVREIRSASASSTLLAARYGVSYQTIQLIKAYKTWKHVA